jgi:repressor LexA
MTDPKKGAARPPPSPRQIEVLAYLSSYQQANESPPTVREICQHFGWRSENAAHSHLRALTELKLVARPGPRRYALRLTAAGRALLKEGAP